MTHDARILDLLARTLDRQPSTAPARLLSSVLAGVERSEQRTPRIGLDWRLRRDSVAAWNARGWLAVAAGLAALAIGASGLLPGARPPAPRPTSTPTPAPSAQAAESAIGTIPSLRPAVDRGFVEDFTELGTVQDGSYASRLNPWVTFELRCSGTNCRPVYADEICVPKIAAGSIELPHAKVCADSVSIIRPDAVDCGTADAHPDAAALAAAMLANPRLGATDLGDLATSPAIPTDLFGAPYRGRVVQVLGGPTQTGSDRARCQLLLAPSLGLPPIEVRSDTLTTLVLVDAGSSLFVVRAMSHSELVDSTSLWLQTHLLSLVHRLRLTP